MVIAEAASSSVFTIPPIAISASKMYREVNLGAALDEESSSLLPPRSPVLGEAVSF
jgi:hypothetical protein